MKKPPPCWCSGSGTDPDWAAFCCAATLMPVLSLFPLKWAKNNLPRCRGREQEGTPCPLLESTCSNYCSPTSSHGSCAGIAEDDMTKWCKPERRHSHRPALGGGGPPPSGVEWKIEGCVLCFVSLQCLCFTLGLSWKESSFGLQLYWCLIITGTDIN